MPLHDGHLRVLIPTTTGLVEILLLMEEDPVIGRSVACIGGTTETADIAAGYHAFVARPTGVIERLFGHSCYRLDVSGRIDAGSSWQLGVLAAHALSAAGRLAQEKEAADGVIWATGSVRSVDLTVGRVSHVPEKLAGSIDRLRQEARGGRPVLVAIPAENAAEIPADARADLAAHGIEVIELADAKSLWGELGLERPDASAMRSSGEPNSARAPRARWRSWPAAAVVAAGLAIGSGVVYPLLHSSPSATDAGDSTTPTQDEAAPPPGPAMRPVQREAEVLVPETVPFVSDRDRVMIRSTYQPARDFKAIAVSSHTMGLITDQPDEETARNGAMAACQRTMEALRVHSKCEPFAVGMRVVSDRSHPPMPAHPWFVRNSAVETPFSGKDLPLVTGTAREQLDKAYPKKRAPKALAISTMGYYSDYTAQLSTDEAVRRALERCGSNSGTACLVVAVDDAFVVPIPRTSKVIGLAKAAPVTAIAPELREEVARRLANATSGWNAVAVGADGNVGIKLGAQTEQAAIDAALADCATRDRTCRVVIIGPFVVESSPAVQPAKFVEMVAALASAIPELTLPQREDLAKKYQALGGHAALAFVPGTGRYFRAAEFPTSDAVEEAVLERCQFYHGSPCATVFVDDTPRPVAADGTSVRDMARVRYAGTFDPEHIPGVSARLRARSDIVQYAAAAGPKAAAYHAWGRVFTAVSAENQLAAETLALDHCNADATRRGQDGPCHLYAIGNQVVLPQRLTLPATRRDAVQAR